MWLAVLWAVPYGLNVARAPVIGDMVMELVRGLVVGSLSVRLSLGPRLSFRPALDKCDRRASTHGSNFL